jgi:hypothetical protein
MMGICDHYFIDLPILHFESPGLHYERLRTFTTLFEPLNLLNFYLYADPGPASYDNVDLYGSGSAILSLILRLKHIFFLTFLEELLLTMF